MPPVGWVFDRLKAGQLLTLIAMIPLRVAILRPDQDKWLHIIWTSVLFCCCFLSKAGHFVLGSCALVASKNLRRLVRGLLQTSNMTLEFHDAVGGRAGNGSCWFYDSKISENFCGIFVLLCYIPAPLMNRN
jgi:hypothetical protein